MSTDYFQSHTISLILSWIFSIPIVIAAIAGLVSMLLEKEEGIPRLLLIWIGLCIIVLSPFRYMVLQLFMATAYPFQSFTAFFTLFLLGIYIPIVLSILYAIGLGLPFLGMLAIAGFKTTISKTRLFFVAVACPFLFFFGNYLFYHALPYAAYSTHWLNAKDVIRVTNGPAKYVYKYVVEQGTVLEFPRFATNMGLENLTSKERLRAHVAAVYLGKEEFYYYIYKAYPEYAESRKKNKSDNLIEAPQEWPELSQEKQAELNAVSEKMMREPLEEDLERVRRVNKNYTKRIGRQMTEQEVMITTQAIETISQYKLEFGRCLLQSIDTKKPLISDDLKRLRGKMEDLGYARKSKLDADFRQIVSAANNEVWTDESGKKFDPLKREDVLKWRNNLKMVNNNINKYIRCHR